MDDHLHLVSGAIEIICGSMFSGKSEELIRRLKRAAIARQKVEVFKHSLDDRFHAEEVSSHSGFKYTALSVRNATEIEERIQGDTKVVGIDEAQFFDDDLPQVCERLADSGRRVILAGLDQDFLGRPFGPMPTLLALAERVDKLQAICLTCGRPASKSQRLINGSPAPKDSPQVVVGAKESYEARCRHCHSVPSITAEAKDSRNGNGRVKEEGAAQFSAPTTTPDVAAGP